MQKRDELCHRTLEFFIEQMFNFIANFAAMTQPRSGMYIVGNIINKIKEYLIEEGVG